MTRDIPILFSGPMVRAILAGEKTQTRRVITGRGVSVKHDYWDKSAGHPLGEYEGLWPVVITDDGPTPIRCPYGVPGDRLWVKETWRPAIAHSCRMDTCVCANVNVTYQADGAVTWFPEQDIPDDWTMPKAASRGFVPSIFMPSWAPRIRQLITSIRVERLQDITEEDAKAEGVEYCDEFGHDDCFHGAIGYRCAFERLWDSINSKLPGFSWRDNPYVWVIVWDKAEVRGG